MFISSFKLICQSMLKNQENLDWRKDRKTDWWISPWHNTTIFKRACANRTWIYNTALLLYKHSVTPHNLDHNQFIHDINDIQERSVIVAFVFTDNLAFERPVWQNSIYSFPGAARGDAKKAVDQVRSQSYPGVAVLPLTGWVLQYSTTNYLTIKWSVWNPGKSQISQNLVGL